MIHTLEIRQLVLRYSALRTRRAAREAQLVTSVERHGQRVPVVVSHTSGQYVLLDGYKRVLALQKLGLDTVTAFCWTLQEDEGLVVQTLLQESAAPSALEMGWLMKELRERFGHSEAELARLLCKSKSVVSRCLALAEALPTQIQQWVREGRVGAWAAMKFLVPLARANPVDAESIAEWMKQARPSSREVAQVYAAYQCATAEGRAWLASHPAAALKVAPKVVPTVSDAAQDAEVMFHASVRLRRRIHMLSKAETGARELSCHHVTGTFTQLVAICAALGLEGKADAG